MASIVLNISYCIVVRLTSLSTCPNDICERTHATGSYRKFIYIDAPGGGPAVPVAAVADALQVTVSQSRCTCDQPVQCEFINPIMPSSSTPGVIWTGECCVVAC